MKVYQYDDQPGDPRQPHHSGLDIDISRLTALGVEHHFLPRRDESDSFISNLALSKDFGHRDEITYSPAIMGPSYESQVAANWHEHIHEHDEIRYIMAGSGYFDIREADDATWVRMKVDPGDLIVLPRGTYHRFMVDEHNDITMTRLFKDADHIGNTNRSIETDALQARQAYLASLDNGRATA